MIQQDYLSRVYAGFLGMNIGIRLGAPVEPTIWSYERIKNTYGEITDYVKDFKNFAADDDVNGPVFFLRALYDDAKNRDIVPQDVARAWLNYSREGKGMFWWGGYGISTEHTAYTNLKKGIPAPASGSIAQNGKILAEQIGGQIFIDTWGLIFPGNPQKAADFGEAAASVSHGGEGVLGARFFCACIAEAFQNSDIASVIHCGLKALPSDSTYVAVSKAVLDFYQKEPLDWRACHEMLVADWGYDKYLGVCHIIPNAGVCILAMIYGQGNFARTIEIATMCGWDTDCNAGNVGTVLGVMVGVEGLPSHYREPINDGLVLSGISGSLNILDIPTYAKELTMLGYQLAGEFDQAKAVAPVPGEVHFDFELPGSTHNLRLSDSFFCKAEHSTARSHKGEGALKILFDRMSRGERCKIYYKPFYRREDFSDERYSPVFSPTVYPGQRVSLRVLLDQWNGFETMGVAPYVRTTSDKKDHLQGFIKLVQDQWVEISFVIPDVAGDMIDEVGLVIEAYSPAKAKSLGVLYLDEFHITGSSKYSIVWRKQAKEFSSITPLSTDQGAWDLVAGSQTYLSSMCAEQAFAYGGNYFSQDYQMSCLVVPQNGTSHLLVIRAQGAMRGYAAGFSDSGKVAIMKNDFGYQALQEKAFSWKIGQAYFLEIKAHQDLITLSIDGKEVLSARDEDFSYGMYGVGNLAMGRTYFGDWQIVEESKT